MTKCAICKKDDEGTGVTYYNKNVCGRCYVKYDDLKKKLMIKEEVQFKLA